MSDEELRRLEQEFRINQDEGSALRFALAYIRQNDPPPAESSEERLRKAHGVLERDYMEDVESIAEDIRERIRTRDITEDNYDDAIFESVNGCQRVIYTFQAKGAIMYSDNAEAALEQGLVDTSTWGEAGINWSQLALGAMHADVRRMLRDVDWNVVEEEEEETASEEDDADD